MLLIHLRHLWLAATEILHEWNEVIIELGLMLLYLFDIRLFVAVQPRECLLRQLHDFVLLLVRDAAGVLRLLDEGQHVFRAELELHLVLDTLTNGLVICAEFFCVGKHLSYFVCGEAALVVNNGYFSGHVLRLVGGRDVQDAV